MELVTTGLASNEQGFTNAVYVTPADLAALATAAGMDPEAATQKGVLCAVNEGVFVVRGFDRQLPGKVGVGMLQRLAGNMRMDAPVPITPFRPSGHNLPMSNIMFEVDALGKAPDREITIDAPVLADHIRTTYLNNVFKLNQSFAVLFERQPLRLTVRSFEYMPLDGSAPTGESAAAVGAVSFGQITRPTEIMFKKGAAAPIKITGSTSTKGSKLFDKGFDFEALGIGGLNKEFADIFRRAFASRLVPPDVLRKMGQHHVRGMLLYGPPGCGKTLIARQIGKALHAHPPKVVNGPEVLNKYVGQSEENIRLLFADAEKEQAERGDDSELHIIIFDEFDAIVKQRGTTGGGTGVNDSIVNQLLSKIDGVESLNNILIIGMTNRKDLIDEAILRPGRLEIHVEIGLPDDEGRLQILNIHTASMRTNKLLAPDVDIADISKRTKNYTGAELEGLVRTACTYVYARQVDVKDLSNVKDFVGVQVTREDFERALSETSPAFGVKEDELTRCIANGMISHGHEFDRLVNAVNRLTHQVLVSDRSPLVSVMLYGKSGSGKSALAAYLAKNSGFPFVKRISGESLVTMHEAGKADAITRVFNDAYKSPLSLIILDDIERLIEYVAVGMRFSNVVLQTLMILVKALPPPGRRMVIIGTTAQEDVLRTMGLLDAFQLVAEIPQLKEREQFLAVFKATGLMELSDAELAASDLADKEVSIKKLLTILDMARMDDDGKELPTVTHERLTTTLVDWGL